MFVSETPGSTAERLEVLARLDGASTNDVYRAFTDAVGLTAWWAEEADVEHREGGALVVRWPSMSWVMRGRFTQLVSGSVVAFTWSWDHEPDGPERTVHVGISGRAGGTDVTISHGDYGPEDGDERQSHLDGWMYFLPRLAASLSG